MLSPSKKSAYQAIRTIYATKAGRGLLKEYAEAISITHKFWKVDELLSRLDGEELASAMSSQIEGNLTHLRRLRARMGTGQYLSARETVSAFVSIYNDSHQVDDDGHGLGHRRMVTGGMFGLETLLKNEMVAGMALSDGRARITHTGPHARSHNYEDVSRVDFYLLTKKNAKWQSVTTFGLGFHSFTFDREIESNLRSKVNDMDGTSVNFSEEVSYTCYMQDASTLRAYFSVLSSINNIGAFSEYGAGPLSLEGDARKAWATDLNLGVRYTQAFRWVQDLREKASITLQAGVVASVGDTTTGLDLRFAGAPKVGFHVQDAKRNRFGYNVGAELMVPMAPGFVVTGTLGAVARGDSHEVSASVGVWFSF